MKTYKVKCNDCQAVVINGHATHETGCHSIMIFQPPKGNPLCKYRVWSLDVWGNDRDGFEVNDRSEMGFVMVPLDADDKSLLSALRKEGFLSLCRAFTTDGDLKTIHISYKDKPCLQLEAV